MMNKEMKSLAQSAAGTGDFKQIELTTENGCVKAM